MINKIFLLLFIVCVCYGKISSEAADILKEIDLKNNDYYSGERLVKVSEANDILKRVETSASLSDNERLYLKIECYTLLANTSINAGTFIEDYKTLKNVYKNIRKEKSFKKGFSEIYSAYADFANSMIALSFFNKVFPYSMIVDVYTFSRLALIRDPNNIKAKQLYGMWQCTTLNYYANNLFYSIITSMYDTTGLPKYMIYRSHIYLSMAYMRVNETEKAFKELEEAENIYPNGFFSYMLKSSYAKGNDGFISMEGPSEMNKMMENDR